MIFQTLFDDIELVEDIVDIKTINMNFKLLPQRYRAISSQIFYNMRHFNLQDFYIIGGSASNFYHYSPTTIEEMEYDIDIYYIGDIQSLEYKYFLKEHEQYLLSENIPQYENSIFNVKSYRNMNLPITRYQLIPCVEFKTIRELLNKFDFEHVKPYYNVQTGNFYITDHQQSLIHNMKLELTEYGKKYPSTYRQAKWIQKGYSHNN